MLVATASHFLSEENKNPSKPLSMIRETTVAMRVRREFKGLEKRFPLIQLTDEEIEFCPEMIEVCPDCFFWRPGREV
tara:strand:+ start:54 stop:284 length:231 start_codon:yes stop_codon:yes gene_type:complete